MLPVSVVIVLVAIVMVFQLLVVGYEAVGNNGEGAIRQTLCQLSSDDRY